MLVRPAWAMFPQLQSGWGSGKYLLFAPGVLVEIIQVWLVIEGALMWSKARGVLPQPLPPLRGVPVTVGAGAAGAVATGGAARRA